MLSNALLRPALTTQAAGTLLSGFSGPEDDQRWEQQQDGCPGEETGDAHGSKGERSARGQRPRLAGEWVAGDRSSPAKGWHLSCPVRRIRGALSGFWPHWVPLDW